MMGRAPVSVADRPRAGKAAPTGAGRPRRASLLMVAMAALVAAVTSSPRAAAEPVTVAVSVDCARGNCRLLLTHTETLDYRARQKDAAVEIEYTRPVRFSPPQMRFDDNDILRQFRVQDERKLVLSTGAGFARYETFELRNPFRLVIDLNGRQPETGRTPAATPSRSAVPRRIIVIDPGHGGIETGAVGPGGLMEKDVTLELSRRLRTRLQRTDSRLSVVLTRDEDRLVGLDERTAIANHNQADLFVSVHLNAAAASRASGAETYFLSPEATDDEARVLAALENRSAGGADAGAGPGAGARRDLDLVLWDLAQNQYLAESSALAEAVQAQLNALTGTRNRGVRQAPFRVLMGATMPAILVEVGFITNPVEEAKFNRPEYLDQVVQALATAISDYLADSEQVAAPAPVGLRELGPP